MRILHVVPGLDEVGNGISVAAKLIAEEQGADLMEAWLFAKGKGELADYDEVWVHSCWLPMTLKSCQRVLRAGKPLVRMTHANLDPVRLRYHGWKKWLVGPIERWCLRRCAKIVATCEAEAEWIRAYEPRVKSIEVADIKRFFNLSRVERVERVDVSRKERKERKDDGRVEGERERDEFSRVERVDRVEKGELHLLYLGRRHPLKGVEYLEKAVAELNSNPVNPVQNSSLHISTRSTRLKIVSSAFGEELEKVWEWCDVLVLPTLSENFGLVIAEALERGKRVITTDGAPAWGENLSRAQGSSWSSELELESGELGVRGQEEEFRVGERKFE